MGVVYEAEQVSLGRRVALKVRTQQTARDAKQKRRFEREAKAAARLHHTNIVPVFGTGEHAGTAYYVMQFIQGLGLDVVIDEVARMGPSGPPTAPPVSAPAPTRRDVPAVAMARSLMTGEFHAPADEEPAPADDAPTLTAAQVAAAIAAPPKVRPEVPRDPATIIEKAVEKDPARRYPTAAELEADLQRFVDDEPILARRLSAGERVWWWCRHHPAVASRVGAIAVLMTAVTVGSLLAAGHFNRLRWNEAQAAASEREAKEEAKRAEERERAEREQAQRAGKAAEESEKRSREALRKGEEHYAKARAAVNDYLNAVSDDPRLKEPGLQGLRAQLLQSALGFYQDFLKERADDPTLRRELAHVYFRVGDIYLELGQRDAAAASRARPDGSTRPWPRSTPTTRTCSTAWPGASPGARRPPRRSPSGRRSSARTTRGTRPNWGWRTTRWRWAITIPRGLRRGARGTPRRPWSST
jgi:hypothetical protein